MTNEDIKLSECTLNQYKQALVEANQRQGLWIKDFVDFFGDSSFASHTKDYDTYPHHVCQYAMMDYFKSHGFEKVREVNYDENGFVAGPVMEPIKIDLENSFSAYRDATVFFENKKTGKKAIFTITANRYDDEKEYRLCTAPESGVSLEGWHKYARKHNLYRGKIIMSNCKFLDLKKIGWENVIIPVGIKNVLQNMIIRTLQNSEIMKANHLSLKRGFLIEGTPGNGKTMIIKALFNTLPAGVTGILALPSQMKDASSINQVCRMAKDLAPCVLAIEDIDWVAEDRSSNGDAGKLMELMNFLDGVEDFSSIITIGTTNAVDTIEEAIKNRPGRFDRVIHIANPDVTCRREMFEVFTRPYKKEGVDVDQVIEFTDNLSGAHMADLVATAVEKALEHESFDKDTNVAILRAEHFQDALEEVKNKNYSSYLEKKNAGRSSMGFSAILRNNGR